jgi:hypothetical protein
MESDSDSDFTTTPFRRLLEKLYDDLTDAARDLRRLRYALRENPSFTYPHSLRQDVRDLTTLKKASMEDLVKLWMPGWKVHGRRVRLGDGPEVALLGFQPFQEVDVYDIFTPMKKLFKN